MLLKNPAYNPMPAGAVSGFVKTPDGMELRYARWKAHSQPVLGTVLLLHGRTENIEKLYETTNDILKRGFEVVSFDWRGQGGSSRIVENPRRGYVDDFQQYVVDLETIVDHIALPDCKAPFYILAHSTGALVALLAAPRLSNRIRRMVLSAPFLGLGRQPISPSMVKTLAGAFCMFGLGEKYMAGNAALGDKTPFKDNIHTSDPDRYERNRQLTQDYPELAIGGSTAAWVYAACRAHEQINNIDFHKQITIPTLFIMAGNDVIVSKRAIEQLAKRLRSGSCLTINGARHELLQEKDIFREQLLAAFGSFIPGSDI